MNTIETIMIGLQIGFQLFASYYCIKIMRLKFTPTSPYMLLLIAFLTRTLILMNEYQSFLSFFVKNAARLVVSALTMIAVVQIYYLIKRKTQ